MIQSPVYFYFLRGQGAELGTSLGVDNLAGRVDEKFRPRCNFMQKLVLDWTDYRLVIQSMDRHRNVTPMFAGLSPTVNIEVGFSLGGNGVDWDANWGPQDVPIDLLITEDPTIRSVILPIHNNVKDFVEIVNTNALNIVGQADIPRAKDFKGKFTRILTAEPHLTVDWDETFARRAISEIDWVLTQRERAEAKAASMHV